MELKYVGVNPEVRFKGIIFKKNIWQDCNISISDVPFDFETKKTDKKEREKKEQSIKKPVASDFSELSNINGVGEETIEDINKIYSSMKQLRTALKFGKCPLRNDICKKLIIYMKENKLW